MKLVCRDNGPGRYYNYGLMIETAMITIPQKDHDSYQDKDLRQCNGHSYIWEWLHSHKKTMILTRIRIYVNGHPYIWDHFLEFWRVSQDFAGMICFNMNGLNYGLGPCFNIPICATDFDIPCCPIWSKANLYMHSFLNCMYCILL